LISLACTGVLGFGFCFLITRRLKVYLLCHPVFHCFVSDMPELCYDFSFYHSGRNIQEEKIEKAIFVFSAK